MPSYVRKKKQNGAPKIVQLYITIFLILSTVCKTCIQLQCFMRPVLYEMLAKFKVPEACSPPRAMFFVFSFHPPRFRNTKYKCINTRTQPNIKVNWHSVKMGIVPDAHSGGGLERPIDIVIIART